MAQLKTSIHNYGGTSNNTGSMGTVNLDPYTYNPRYPGFDEANYRKLESKINALGLTGYEREKAMDEAYQQILPIVQNEIKNSDRREYINQANYEVSQIQDPQARKEAQGKLTVTQLSQQLKEKYNLDPSAPDEEVFNSWINSMPNGGQLLADYMNDGNRELLYQGGLETKQEVPETQEPTVGGIQGIINEQSQTSNDTALGKANNILDRGNPVGKITQWVDGLVQKIPTATYETKVQNLANRMNSLTEDEYQNLYDQYVRMLQNGSDEKWKNDDRDGWALFWDAITGDKDALDRVNTLHLYDYSGVADQNGIERNSWGTQLWDKVANGATLEEINQNIDAQNAPKISKALAKGSVWTTDKMKNLLNFVGRSYGGLQNYAEALGVGLQKLDDIRDNRFAPTAGLENNEEAFTAYVADKVANFGEYMTDAPDTLLGNPVSPNAVKFFSNIPQSFLKTLTAKVRGKTNPLDTKIGLAKMLFTDEGQQALINRYGSPEALANTMNTDPIGLASDMIDMADKFNLVLNKTTGGAVERQSMGDVTDALSDDFVKGLGASLNYTSEWLNNKGNQKTAGLVDIATDAALNPNKLAQDITKEGKLVANDMKEIPADIQERAKERANKKLQNINRMKKGEQEEFKQMSKGIDQGEFQNQRGLKNTEDLANYLTKNLEQVDTAMEAIQGRRKSKELDTVMDDVLKYAVDTEDPRAGRLQELYNKNKEGGLEMAEINEVKRYYERTNIFDYLKDSTKGKQRRRATNRDTALREWQYKIAEEAGLDNLKELNQETRLTKYLLDNATDRKAGVKGNNDISLTDWIVASGGGLDAAGIAALVGKKVYQSNWFQEKLVDVYNYIGGRELIETPTVDMSKIQQSNVDRAILAQELANVKTEQQFNQWLEKAQAMAGPALPYNENFNGEPTTTIRVTPEGQNIRQGRRDVNEINEAPSNYVRQPEMANSEGEMQEMSIRDAVQEASMPQKGVSIKEQLRGVENNNVNSVEDRKYDITYEQRSEKDLKNELSSAKKQYDEAVKDRENEGGYYNRDRAADLQNKIEAINDMLNDNVKTQQTEKIRSKLQKEIANMELGDEIKVTDTIDGKDYTFTIKKAHNGYHRYEDNKVNFMENEEMGPDGVLSQVDIKSYEKLPTSHMNSDTPTGMDYLDYRHELHPREVAAFKDAIREVDPYYNNTIEDVPGLLEDLKEILGTDKKVNNFLKKMGYEGIEYRDHYDRIEFNNGEEYVRFNKPKVTYVNDEAKNEAKNK